MLEEKEPEGATHWIEFVPGDRFYFKHDKNHVKIDYFYLWGYSTWSDNSFYFRDLTKIKPSTLIERLMDAF